MATLRDIALRAKVSIGTVDRVLHGRGRVSLETAHRVKQIVKELNYKPNILARSLSLAKMFNFAALLSRPDQDGNYWELPLKGIERAQQELDVYKVKITHFHFDKYSEKSFEEACSSLLAQADQIDGIIMAPVLANASERFLQRLPKRLSYIFLDSYLPESHCLSYIGEDSFQSGVLSAKLMNLLINSGGVVAVLRMRPRDFHIEERIRGFQSFFKDFPNVITKSYVVDAREQSSYFKEIKGILANNATLVGIFTPSARSFEVAEALEKIAPEKNIFLIGYDLVEKNISLLQEGRIDFLISQRSDRQGYEGLYSLYKTVVLEEHVEARVVMPLDIITKENLHFYTS